MVEITRETIEQKLANKETLTKEENKFVMESVDDGDGKDSDGEDVDFTDAEDLDKDKDKKDDKAASGTKDENAKPSDDKEKDKNADKGADKTLDKKTDKKEETAKPDTSDKKDEKAEEGIFQKVEKELDKPEGTEDLSGLSDREKGLYYALKAERKKRQKAEEDRDEVLFRDLKTRKQAEAKAALEKKEAEEEKEEDIVIEGEDDDFITKKDAKKIIDALKKGGKKGKEGEVDEVAAANRKTALRIAEMSARDVVESRVAGGQKDLPDFDTTMKIGEMIVEANPEYQKEIYKAYVEGRNPALITYDLVRKDPKFASLYGKKSDDKKTDEKPEEKAKEGKETLKKIEENVNKPKTSGAQGGGSGDSFEGYTLQQLNAMTPSEFRKVPKHIREKFLYNT